MGALRSIGLGRDRQRLSADLAAVAIGPSPLSSGPRLRERQMRSGQVERRLPPYLLLLLIP